MNQYKMINESFDKQLKEADLDKTSVTRRLHENTVKQGNSWVNKGEDGTHGKFKTKKAADALRKAMFANGFKEALTAENAYDFMYELIDSGIVDIKNLVFELIKFLSYGDLVYFIKANGYDEFFDDDMVDDSTDECLTEASNNRNPRKYTERLVDMMDEGYDVYELFHDLLYFLSDSTVRKYMESEGLLEDDSTDECLTEASKKGTYYYINDKLSEKDVFYRSLRNTGTEYVDSDKLRKGITIDNTKFQIRSTPIDEAMDISGIKGTIANAFTAHKGDFNSAKSPRDVFTIANDILVEQGVNINAPSVVKFLNLLQKSKSLNNSLSIVYNYILAGSGLKTIK